MIAQLMALADSGQPELVTPEDAQPPRALPVGQFNAVTPASIRFIYWGRPGNECRAVCVKRIPRPYKRLNLTQRPVERAFKALEAHGWIKESNGGTGRRPVVLLKSPLPASPEAAGEADE